jgi:hypothetical protein
MHVINYVWSSYYPVVVNLQNVISQPFCHPPDRSSTTIILVMERLPNITLFHERGYFPIRACLPPNLLPRLCTNMGPYSGLGRSYQLPECVMLPTCIPAITDPF